MIEIAKILKPQGIYGEVKVQLFSNNTEGFAQRGFAYLKDAKKMSYSVSRIDRDCVYMRIDGVNTRNDAESLRGVFLYIDRSDFEELDNDEHYICDLIGLRVVDEKGNELGLLKEILQHGAADVYVVKGSKSCMFPALKSVIVTVEDSAITVNQNELDKVAVYED